MMDTSGLVAQHAIVLPVLADAHATLSAGSSMGQLLVFESVAGPAVTDLTSAVQARRVTRTLARLLPKLSEASGLIAGQELEQAVDAAREALREDGTNDAALDGTAMAHAVLVMEALERARLACAVLLDACEAMGIAPNGKPLPNAPLRWAAKAPLPAA